LFEEAAPSLMTPILPEPETATSADAEVANPATIAEVSANSFLLI